MEERCERIKIDGLWHRVVGVVLCGGPEVDLRPSPVESCTTSGTAKECSTKKYNGKGPQSVVCKYPQWMNDRMREFRGQHANDQDQR